MGEGENLFIKKGNYSLVESDIMHVAGLGWAFCS